ncbi:MAG: RHS repeat-associated core domain-containing protein [Micropepsaceae bacterium]
MSAGGFARAAALAFAALVFASAGAAFAQVPPERIAVDERGVDLLSGKRRGATDPGIVIGQPGANGLASPRNDLLVGTRGSAIYPYRIGGTGAWYFRASFETFSVSFQYVATDNGANFIRTDVSGAGWTLERKDFGEKFTLTSPNGMVVEYDTTLQFQRVGEGPPFPQPNEYAVYTPLAAATSMTMPDGLVLTYHHAVRYLGAAGPNFTSSDSRVQSVTTNYGYQLKHTYAQNGSGGTYENWIRRTSSMLINNAVDYCSPNADSCTGLTQTWPKVDYAAASYTDTLGNVTSFTNPAVSPFTVTSPAGVALTYTWNVTTQQVTQVSNGTQTYNYAWSDSAGIRTVTITGPGSYSRVVTSNIDRAIVLTDKDALNRTTTYTYNAGNLVTRVTYPEGNYVNYTYDARGNVTETRAVAKSGSGLADIVTTASYDATCTIPAKCDKPNYTIDARGGRTDYTYDSTHGGVLTITAPAPGVGGTRPQTRYTYTQLYAWVKNAGGTLVQAATPIYMLTGVSSCTTGTSCAGAASEVKTTIVYGAPSVANNLLPTSVTSGAGDGSLTATVTSTYDHAGNPFTVDGPLPGANDVTRYRFDALRRSIGVVGPDPDWGGGPLKHRAVRTSYNADSQPVLVERGIVDGYTDPDWAAFVVLDQQEATYDALGRLVKAAAVSGGVTQAVAQTSYDAAGRPECSALRMNPAVFGALPGSACTLGTAGANGPDRISKVVYDAADQVLQTIRAFGTALQQIEVTATYTSNGQTATVADAKGNLTTYVYDGFDRLSRRRYPVVSGSGSSTTDYEEYTYDAASNVATERRRDGTVISYTYDALNRLISSDLPATTFAYDNLGRMVSAATAAGTLSWTHDALNRAVSKTDAFGTWGYSYDLAGDRTRMTWPDGFHVDYDYDPTGAMIHVRENGVPLGAPGTLASYYYDNYGRRTNLDRWNGTGTGYGFDAASRLSGIWSDLAGAGYDTARAFTHNPAGQILSQSEGNSLYIWNGVAPATGTWTLNGLNQVLTLPGKTVSHDTKGNISAVSGGATYGYDAANRLTAASGPTAGTLAYDALGRLAQVVTATTTTRFAYDGGRIVAEYDGSGALLRRYVPGAGVDETLVWYEGSGTTDRRYLFTDERGSVIAITDAAGSSIGTNTYDEYGRPGATNMGRFQYTGQAYIPELNLYYYKARFYSADLKRFLQPDPIGYAGGMNLYAYVGGDPVNFTDPSGMLASSKGNTQCTGSHIPDGCGGLMLSTVEGPAGGRGGREGKIVGSVCTSGDGWTYCGSVRYFASGASFGFGRDYSAPSGLRYAQASSGSKADGYSAGVVGRALIECIYGQYCITVWPNGDATGRPYGPSFNTPPEDAYDPIGAKAPGKPTDEEGFFGPKNGEDNWVKNPNGRGYGWEDRSGDVWVPTGQGGGAHGGPHWDVQTPGGGYRNVRPKPGHPGYVPRGGGLP